MTHSVSDSPASAGLSSVSPIGEHMENTVTVSRETEQELRELLEDAIEYVCDNNVVSGQTARAITECLAIAKQAQLSGLVD